jgi:hypothetical protein
MIADNQMDQFFKDQLESQSTSKVCTFRTHIMAGPVQPEAGY